MCIEFAENSAAAAAAAAAVSVVVAVFIEPCPDGQGLATFGLAFSTQLGYILEEGLVV